VRIRTTLNVQEKRMQIILFGNSSSKRRSRRRRRSCVRVGVGVGVGVNGVVIVAIMMIIAFGEFVCRQRSTTKSLRWTQHVHCLTTTTTTINNNNVIKNHNHHHYHRDKNIIQQHRIQQWDYHHRYHHGTNRRIIRPLYTSPPELGVVDSDDDDYTREALLPEEEFGSTISSPSLSFSSTMLLRDLNPSQIEAVTQPLRVQQEHDDPSTTSMVVTRVIAGPGSGKTKVLTTRIGYLLQEDPYGKVLAVTFTRKAAGEMKERLERLLREQQQFKEKEEEDNNNKSMDDDFTNHNDDDDDDDDDETIRMDRYGQIIEQEFAASPGNIDAEGSTNPKGLERVELGTFHSICAKILRYNGDSLRDLPSVQRDMSQATPVYMERQQQPPNRDVGDGEESETESPSMELVHPQINLNGQYAIADQPEQIRILKECLTEQEIDLKALAIKPIQILTTIGKMKEMFAQGQDPFLDQRKKGGGGGAGQTMRMARRIYYPYREKLLTNNAVDFDDLILMTRELLTEDVELRERLHKRWPHVLVDEYQDTSKIQMDLIKLLTSSSLFVVGDADQSIYSWRGAHVGSLEEVKIEFESYGKVRTVFLKENYRSTSNIVKAAEKVISYNQRPKMASNLQKDDNGGDTKGDTKDDLRRSMIPQRDAGPSPRVIACEDERAEANFVVDTILNMTTQEDITPGDTVAMLYRTNAQSRYLEEACVQKNLPYVIRGGAGGFYKRAEIKDCLCFLRWIHNGNDEGAILRAMKTPSKGIGEKTYEEFKSYCETVQTYIRQYYPLNARPSPLDVLISMTNNEDEKDYVLPNGTPEAIDSMSKRALNNFLKFSSKMREIRFKAYTEPIDKLLFFIIEELKLMDHLDSISKSKSEFVERRENVQELRNAAKKYATYGPTLKKDGDDTGTAFADDAFDNESALSNFLDDVALVSDIAEANSEDEENPRLVVNLMTIHASKGTEFDCVFVVGVEEGTLPSNQALQEGEGSVQLEEEKRLCYVAMTRAKTRLILTWRKEVTSFSNWSDSGPKTVEKQRSRFLNAIVSQKSKKSTAMKGITSTRASTKPPSKRSSLNRHGLKGPEGRKNRDPSSSRRSSSSSSSSSSRSTSPSSRRLEYSTLAQTSSSSRNTSASSISQRQQSSNRPSVDRVQQLRSSLKNPSSSSPKQRKTNKTPRSSSSSSSSSSATQQDAVDPMWFFPVGESVVHINLGNGVVLDHPPFERIEDAKVRVKFEDGKTLEFPALGSDVLPL
jgi:DNA helicase-2/ATP-dependent DNA helicase PcrA